MYISVLVYSMMMFVMYLCGKGSLYFRPYRYWLYGFAILVFVVISGIRYDVGVDFMTYHGIFSSFTSDSGNLNLAMLYNERYESGFLGIVSLLSKLGFGPQGIFAAFAFLQIVIIYYIFKDYTSILPYIGITLIAGGEYFMWMNAIRQIVVFAFFLLTIQSIYKKKYIQAVVFVICALLMHKSAVIFLPFLFCIPLLQKGILNVKYQLFILLCSLILSNLQIWQYFTDLIESILSVLGDFGERYSADGVMEVNSELDFGIRALIQLVLNVIAIVFSHKMFLPLTNNNRLMVIFYNMFFIGSVLSLLFADNHALSRFVLYFSSISFIIYAFLLAYLSSHKSKYSHVLKYAVLILLFIYFYRTLQADNGTASILYKVYF